MKSILQVFSIDVLSKVMLGALGIILIRFMPETEYASYTFALSLVAAITQTLASSFNRIYIVGHSRLDLGDSLSSFLGFQLLAIALLVVATVPFANSTRGAYWFIVVLVTATCLSEYAKTFYQRDLKFIRFSMVEFFRTLAFFAGAIALIGVVGFDLRAWQILLLQAVAMSIVAMVAFGKHLRLGEMLRVDEAWRIAVAVAKSRYGFLFGYYVLLAFLTQGDIFMLRAISDDAALATYGSAFRYYMLLILALTAVHTVLLPVIQKAQSADELEIVFARQKKMLAVFAPIVLIGAWASQWIIPAIDMGKYPGAVGVFRILAVSAIISFAFSPHVNLVIRFEDFRFLFILVAVVVPLHIGLNLVLIPALGPIGAAITTLAAFACVNGSVFLRAKKQLRLFGVMPEGGT